MKTSRFFLSMEAVRLVLIFLAAIMEPLRIFLTSNSGYVSRREGLSLGWLVGALAGVATLFGVTEKAFADECGGAPPGQCLPEFCTSDPCDATHGQRKHWCRLEGSGNCVLLNTACDCI